VSKGGIIIGMMKTKLEPVEKIAVLYTPSEAKVFVGNRGVIVLYPDGRVEFPVRPRNAAIARKTHWQARQLISQLASTFLGATKRKDAWWAEKARAALNRNKGGAWWETGCSYIWVYTSGGAVRVQVKKNALEKRAFWLAKYGQELFETAIKKEVI
jgi:hypothetical protein